MKVKCNVCLESPTIEIPHISSVNDGDEINCPNCDKWIATAQVDKWHQRWSLEDTEHRLEDGQIINNYPIEIINK